MLEEVGARATTLPQIIAHEAYPGHHLEHAWKEAGLVDREKRGTWVWYWVVPERLSALRGVLAPGR